MSRLLLVDDDRFVLRSLMRLLGAEGHYCHCAVNAEEARRALAENEPFDMVLLDVGLPDQDGFSLCRQIRTHYRMPVLYLTSRNESSDRVVGLEVGGDDYLAKPFEPRELTARVRAHLRRSQEYNSQPDQLNQIRIGNLILDIDRRDVRLLGEAVRLTEREFELLHLFARNADRALSSGWIYESVWGMPTENAHKTLAVYIRRLRCKIEPDPDNPQYLMTVRGFGYQLTRGEVTPQKL